jgi:hypothetical protein
VFVCLFFSFPPFALFSFPSLVTLSSFYCFCFPSVQSFLNAYSHDQFPFFSSAQALSYASSTGLIGSPKKKKGFRKIHTTKPNKRKLCSKPCAGHEERKSGRLLP